MINMMRADFYRLVRSKVFYIAIVVMLLMIGLSIYLIQPGQVGVAEVGRTEAGTNISGGSSYENESLSTSEYRKIMLHTEGYQLDRDILAENTNLYYVFIFIAAIVLTVDFSNGGIKNTLSSAISRNKYFFSKILFVNICCVALFFLNTFIVYFSNIIFNSKNLASDIETVTKISLLQLPTILAFVSVLTGIGFMVKKTAVFNTVTIPFLMVAQLLFSLLIKIFKIKETLMEYEFQTMVRRLANDPSDTYILHSYLYCAAVIVIFNLLGYMFFKKAEIK